MDILNSKKASVIKIVLATIGTLIILLGIFHLGVMVGFHKARFAFTWGENYHRNFGGPRDGFMQDIRGGNFMSGHGTAGEILTIEGTTLIIKGGNDVEKTIVTNEKTEIVRRREKIEFTGLTPGEKVIIIGSPTDQGQIEAKLIRIFDRY